MPISAYSDLELTFLQPMFTVSPRHIPTFNNPLSHQKVWLENVDGEGLGCEVAGSVRVVNEFFEKTVVVRSAVSICLEKSNFS